MIRTDLQELTEEEFESISTPYGDNFDKYLEKYVVPEVVAFAIATGFERNAIWKGTLRQHYNSYSDRILATVEDYDAVINAIKGILEVKYSLLITNDNPLEIKKIEY